jgi:hypothetical protein
MEFDKKYHIDIPIYELKYDEDNKWNTIPEKIALLDLVDNFERITPIISEMLNGKEINTQHGIFRIRNYLKLNRTYRFKQA